MILHTPIPKFFDFFSKRGLTFLTSTFLVARGAGATFFFPFFTLT